jgi:AmmeMemoRadiSam system protein B
MSDTLPRLRSPLDFLPSPDPGRPGLVLRDPFRYCRDMLLIPERWVPALGCLDGNHSEVDVQALLTRHSGGELVFSRDVREFVLLLQRHGFLETEEFFQLQQRRHAEFRAATERSPIHAGVAYPADEQAVKAVFRTRFSDVEVPDGVGDRVGVAAPHVSPDGGWESYQEAYARLDASLADRTFVVLGTSHFGKPDTFGLTRKPYATPLGRAEVDEESVAFLYERASGAVDMEDYCHAIEHSIEFQVIFLQYRIGVPVRIIPILCGPFVQSLHNGGVPTSSPSLGSFFDALAELAERRQDLFWLLGIDLAHIGRRYGDPYGVRPHEGPMVAVEAQDRERLDRVCEADLAGFHQLVRPEMDPLKWCGYSPLYTFLASLGRVLDLRGRVLKYQQWGIDRESVVTFAGLEFFHSSVEEVPKFSCSTEE